MRTQVERNHAYSSSEPPEFTTEVKSSKFVNTNRAIKPKNMAEPPSQVSSKFKGTEGSVVNSYS